MVSLSQRTCSAETKLIIQQKIPNIDSAYLLADPSKKLSVENENGSTVDGDTGISPTVAGTDENKRFAINIDGAVWICVDITTWAAGTLNLEISGASN